MYAVILYSPLNGDDAVLTFPSSDSARLFCAEYAQSAGYNSSQHCRDNGHTLRIIRICEPCDLSTPPLYYHHDLNNRDHMNNPNCRDVSDYPDTPVYPE